MQPATAPENEASGSVAGRQTDARARLQQGFPKSMQQHGSRSILKGSLQERQQSPPRAEPTAGRLGRRVQFQLPGSLPYAASQPP